MELAGNGLAVERQDGDHGTGRHGDGTYCKLGGAAPAEVETDVVGQHQIAQIAAEVPQGMVFVPEALSPYLAPQTNHEGHAGAHGKEQQEEAFLAGGSLPDPGRNHGDEQVEANEGVHEPQVAGQGGEVEQQAREVGPAGVPSYLPPQHGQGAIEHGKDEHGRKDAHEAAAVECPHRLAFPHGHEQVGRHNHEQGHRHAGESVVDRHPQTVGFVGKIGCGAYHIGGIGRAIIVLGGMDQHHQKACHHAYVVQKYDSFFFSFHHFIPSFSCVF